MTEKLNKLRFALKTRWDRLARAVSRRIPRLSRPWRVARNVACTAAALYFIWLFLGQPYLSERHMFRQAEKRAMVGPSEILGTITMPEGLGSYRRMILGETDNGYCMHPLDEPNTVSSSTMLFYQAKGEGLTLFPAPNHDYPFTGDPYTIALLLFSDLKAAQAEVDLTLSGQESKKLYTHTWTMSADVEEEGFFILSHRIESLSSQEKMVLDSLRSWYDDYWWYDVCEPFCADVRLYNEAGVLILETKVELKDFLEAGA